MSDLRTIAALLASIDRRLATQEARLDELLGEVERLRLAQMPSLYASRETHNA